LINAQDLFSFGSPRAADQTRQIKQWVKAAWSLPQSATVMVAEVECAEPGCPPRETVIAIFDADGAPRQSKLHKAMIDVTARDINDLTVGK